METSFLNTWLLGFSSVVNIVLGITVYRKAPKVLLNRLFLGLALNTGIWTLAVMIILIINDYESLLLWIRISHAIAATIPWFIFTLVYVFKDEKSYPYRKVLPLLIFSLLLAAASFTPAIIEDVGFPLENKEPFYGPYFPLYALHFSCITIYAICLLFLELRKSRGLVRNQIRYFIGGILVAFVMGSLANLFLPLLEITFIDLRPFGPLSTLIMVGSISYAIVKYRLMDIRLAVRRVMAYVIAISFLAGLIIVLLTIVEKYFRIYLESNILPFTLLLVILVALFFQPLKDKFQVIIDNYFYRGAYNYYNTLIDANKAMLSILHMDRLLHFLVDKVVNTIYIEGAVFFLKKRDGSFAVEAERYINFPPTVPITSRLEHGNPLLNYLEKSAGVLLLTDLKNMADKDEKESLGAEMRKLRAEAAVPVIMEGRLEAIFFLGFKISGEPYSKEDVSLLSTLASQVAVALKNAQLYQEVLGIKQYLENILENMGNGLIAVDEKGKITTFNSTAEKLTGLQSRKVLGKKINEVLDPKLCRHMLQTLKSGRKRSEIEVELSAEGLSSSFLCCSTARVQFLETGEQGAIMVLSDVTRIKELEREKSKAEKLASLGELAAGMAHEIKNPLVSIKTFAELLPDKYDDHDFRHSFSKIVSYEIERINKLVMELLNFSRVEVPEYKDVDTRDLIEEILMLLFPQLGAQKIQLSKRYHGDIPLIKADPEQLRQALLNICLNAVQAMPEGGELRVEILSPASSPQGNKVKIIISDTGAGISPEQKDKVFDPFFTTKTNGVGIGLSISHRIISNHGGSVQFSSSSDGTVFDIYLPAVSQVPC